MSWPKYGREVIDRVLIATRQTRPASTETESLALVAQPSQPQCAAVDPSERTACGQRAVDMRARSTRRTQPIGSIDALAGPKRHGRNGLPMAHQSGIAALQQSAQRPQGYLHGILSRCRHPLSTSVVEGINNTIKVIKNDVLMGIATRSTFSQNPRRVPRKSSMNLFFPPSGRQPVRA